MSANKKRTVDVVEDILNEILVSSDLKVWDISFKKEGASWFLRVYIYREKGFISFDDCENVSKNLGQILDNKDVIKNSYFLEVSSPGLERELKRNWHYDIHIGECVIIKFIKHISSSKEIKGILVGYDNNSVVLKVDNEDIVFDKKNISSVRLFVDINFNGGIDKSE